jgi:hypothetical protein
MRRSASPITLGFDLVTDASDEDGPRPLGHGRYCGLPDVAIGVDVAVATTVSAKG